MALLSLNHQYSYFLVAALYTNVLSRGGVVSTFMLSFTCSASYHIQKCNSYLYHITKDPQMEENELASLSLLCQCIQHQTHHP